MKLFKWRYTLTWWQVGIFKLALLAIGIIIGSYWHEFFSANLAIVAIIAIVTTMYIVYAMARKSEPLLTPIQPQ